MRVTARTRAPAEPGAWPAASGSKTDPPPRPRVVSIDVECPACRRRADEVRIGAEEATQP